MCRLKQLILVILVVCPMSFFATDKVDFKKNKADRRLAEQLSHIAKEWCTVGQEAHAAAERANVFATQAKAACDKATAATYRIEIAKLRMVQITKLEGVKMFAGQWVVFKGSLPQRFEEEKNYYPLHDHKTLLELKAGYVSKCPHADDWHTLHRVFKWVYIDGYADYYLTAADIARHKPGLFMRNMTLQEEENIKQALKDYRAKCQGREENGCVLS